MKTIWNEVLLALFMGMILPGLILAVMVRFEEEPEVLEKPTETAPPEAKSFLIKVREAETVEDRDLEQYLVGVVLAEMPAYFEPEALKAQAVVARTYTARTHFTGGKHGDGSICTDHRCCQAYLSEAAYLEKGGTQADVDKVRSAVEETRGTVLSYGGELIEATYFSCSGGRTEDAAAVWGADYPYLRSVESPGEEGAAHYTDTVTFTSSEFENLLGVPLPGEPKTWFGETAYTPGQGVQTMVIGERTYRGTELRTKLGLRSTAFTVTVDGDTISIHTRGYGHRVGMSQYGAEAMAVAGSAWPHILAHYYPGTELAELEIDEKGELLYHN